MKLEINILQKNIRHLKHKLLSWKVMNSRHVGCPEVLLPLNEVRCGRGNDIAFLGTYIS